MEVARILPLLFKKQNKNNHHRKKKKHQTNKPHNTNLLALNSNIHRKDTAIWTCTKRGKLALFMFSQLQDSPGLEMRTP